MIIGEASNDEQAGMHIMLSDVKRAYFHAAAERELYVEIPREDPDWSPDTIGKLNLALYGTRDAAKLWQECVAKHLLSIGFVRGKSITTNQGISGLLYTVMTTRRWDHWQVYDGYKASSRARSR